MSEYRAANHLAAGLMVVLALGGCARMSTLDTRSAEALPPAPIDSVQSSQLDPAAPAQITPDQQVAAVDPSLAPADPLAPQTGVPAGDAASLTPAAPAAAGPPISRESVTGTWVVASDNPECRIILAFTKWAGGYRAATRRCETAEMGTVTAWDVKDNKVVLVDANGNQVASLASAGAERYDGVTAGGKPVNFTR